MLRITRTLVFAASLVAISSALSAQQQKEVSLPEVVVSAIRVNDSIPMAYSRITAEEIQRINLGQDLPFLMNFTPSMLATSYDGLGVGYTDYRIRGIDNSRINVTINGIPYNDADSQTTFFVNLQDFASSLGSIQIQRGVGTSTNGSAAFGASISLATQDPSEEAFARYSSSAGSFGTFKNTVQFGTGRFNGFSFEGRLSHIQSEGYVDRATSDLKSYFLNATFKSSKNSVNLLFFGGTERTGLSFFGLDRAGLEVDRRRNYDGIYYDSEGVERVYPNQTDNYAQDHIQLHYLTQISNSLQWTTSLHFTKSKGFYEQIQDFDNPFVFFRNVELLEEGADYASRAHLNSDYFGVLTVLKNERKSQSWQLGLSANRYLGDQFGEVVQADLMILSDLPFEFYRNYTQKAEISGFFKYQKSIVKGLSSYLDLQLRGVSYRAAGNLFAEGGDLEVDQNYHFFNPKFGLTYDWKSNQVYASFARAHREPTRVDFENGTPEAEQLDNIEVGFRRNHSNWSFSLGAFYMDYKNQLVLTGELDPFNFPIRENIGSSYRAGVETELRWSISNRWILETNATWSRHRNLDFIALENGVAKNFGDTRISFAPEWISSMGAIYELSSHSNLSLFLKNVGSQYMSNIEHPDSLIDGYSVVDVMWNQEIDLGKDRSLRLSLQLNNILNLEYENNGYFYSFEDQGQTVYGSAFYPQAPRNFLAGCTIEF